MVNVVLYCVVLRCVVLCRVVSNKDHQDKHKFILYGGWKLVVKLGQNKTKHSINSFLMSL